MLVGGLNAADKADSQSALTCHRVSSLHCGALVKEGEPFIHDQYVVKAGWKFADDGEEPTIKHLVVTSYRHSRAMAVLMFHLYKGKHEVGRIACTSPEMRFGETFSQTWLGTGYNWREKALDCSGRGYPRAAHRWTSIKVQAETWRGVRPGSDCLVTGAWCPAPGEF